MHEGTILAFDFGTRRIGVAVGEMMLGIARPLTTISAEANDARFAAIGKLIEEWRPNRLIVGLPLSLDGEASEMTDRCRRFARQLEGRYRLPVVLVDERLTSTAAEERLRERGLDWRQRKATLDAEAAATLLQSYFDERQHEDTQASR
ncbi:MAG TPA: Holliday junction resolvase RuvX [Rhodocyclaceae bacterium]|nr:Holliday junction resolvase RuvX [Rhodocyclaceae bacterium]